MPESGTMANTLESIQGRHNQQLKLWRDCLARPERKECPWIAVEGQKQITDLLEERRAAVVIVPLGEIPELLVERSEKAYSLPAALFRQLSTVRSSRGSIAFFRKPSWDWTDVGRCILYLDRVQDPGNLGTLLRSAAATGLFSVVNSPGTVSCFNSKVVRATAGTLFKVPCLQEVEIGELVDRGYQIAGTSADSGSPLFNTRLDPPVAVVLGNEGAGVSDKVRNLCDPLLHIPMSPGSDSLNTAVAGALIMYEVYRQQAAER
jgi:TrmH family RNA methyltransferase